MKKNILSLFALFIGLSGSSAMAQHYTCGTDVEHAKLLRANPKLMQQIDAIRQQEASQRNGVASGIDDSVLVIPTVVHVIHNYGSENISVAQINDALRILNEDFQLKNADTNLVLPFFKSRIGNPRVEFRLAQKDPQGNPTMGITRTVSEQTNSADNGVKDLIGWGTKYFNIWIVSNIASGAGAYAHYPGSVQPSYEGVVARASQFGSIGASGPSNFSARTLTHEVGHYLNLPHTWGSTNTPGDAGNCSTDDGVADTPNTIGVAAQNCNRAMPGCVAGEIANVENYMDYSNCARMYTQGQVSRMRTALASSVGGRSNLWSLNNKILTGVNNGYVAPLGVPRPDFTVSLKQLCSGKTVSFTASVYNVISDSIPNIKYRWVFTGGTPSVSFGNQANVTYNTAGTYAVKLITSNSAGRDSIQKTSYITVLEGNSFYSAASPSESFDVNTFPNFAGASGKSWQVGSGWQRRIGIAKTGAASLGIDNRFVPDQTISSISSSGFDLTGIEQPVYLSFDLAFARTSTTSRDVLKVYVSTNCGSTWSPALYTKTAVSSTSPLGTTGSTLVPSNTVFIPTATQWRRELVNLNNYATATNLRIKFEMTSRTGNWLYIDDVTILKNPLVSISEALHKFKVNVYPNPFEDAAQVSYTLTESENVSAVVTDMLGREVWSANQHKQEVGEHAIELPTSLASGMYILNLQIGEQRMAQKIVKQ